MREEKLLKCNWFFRWFKRNSTLSSFWASMNSLDPYHSAFILTLYLVVFFYSGNSWFLRGFAACTALAVFIDRKIIDKPIIWFILASMMTFRLFDFWYPVKQSYILIVFWCWSLALVTLFESVELKKKMLALSGRLFLCLSMGFASIQKFLSPDFLSGGFFEYVLLTDLRFSHVVELFGGDLSLLKRNTIALRKITHFFPEGSSNLMTPIKDLYCPRLLPLLAKTMTWWTFIVESLIGLSFMLNRRSTDILGHILLFIFIIAVYTNVPHVISFGIIIMIFGISISHPSWHKLRLTYLVASILFIYYVMAFRVLKG